MATVTDPQVENVEQEQPEEVVEQTADVEGQAAESAEAQANETTAVEEQPPGEETAQAEEPTPEPTEQQKELDRYHAWDSELREMNAKAAELEAVVQNLQKRLKTAKSNFEDKQAEIRELIARGPNQPSLFDNVRPFKPATNGAIHNGTPTAEASKPAPVEEVPDESWKEVKLSEILPEQIVDKLENFDPPLRTLGDLTDWKKDDRHRLTDIRGIGPAKADMIDDAVVKYFEEHPIKVKNSEEPAADADKPTDKIVVGDKDMDEAVESLHDAFQDESWYDGVSAVLRDNKRVLLLHVTEDTKEAHSVPICNTFPVIVEVGAEGAANLLADSALVHDVTPEEGEPEETDEE